MTGRAGVPVRRDEHLMPHSFFAMLSNEHRMRFRETSPVRSFRKGERPEMPAAQVLLVEEGWIKLPIGDQRIEIRGPGDFAGKVASNLDRHPITCVTRVLGRQISAARFASFVRSSPAIDRAVNRALAARAERADVRLIRAGLPAERRLALQLVDLAGMARSNCGVLPLSEDELAWLIGASRRTVTRTLAGWRTAGIVSVGYREVCVRDWPELAEIGAQRRGSSGAGILTG